jgi:hypothetical protein
MQDGQVNSLTFKGQIGQCCIKRTSFFSEWENTVLHWAFKLSSALTTTQTWHLKGHILKVKHICKDKGKVQPRTGLKGPERE